jgi:phospholipid/cholesterol/gamma-HCH transport system substrate-binding protein
MESSRSREIKVGIVTIIAIILFILGISLVNKYGVAVDYVEIKMRFPNSAGIEKTAPILINGVKRGQVTNVAPDNGSVVILGEIDRIDDLHEDLTAKIGMLEITGGKKIDISPGTSSEKFNPANEIQGKTSPGLGEMIALVGEMGSDAGLLLKKLDTIATAASLIINDERLSATIENTHNITANLNDFVQNNISELQTSVNNLKAITSELKSAIDKYEPKADEMMTKLDNTIEDTQKLMRSADEAIANANNFISELSEFSKELKNTDGLAGKLVYDKKFAEKIDSTFNTLYDFLLQVKQHGININTRLGTRP